MRDSRLYTIIYIIHCTRVSVYQIAITFNQDASAKIVGGFVVAREKFTRFLPIARLWSKHRSCWAASLHISICFESRWVWSVMCECMYIQNQSTFLVCVLSGLCGGFWHGSLLRTSIFCSSWHRIGPAVLIYREAHTQSHYIFNLFICILK